MTSKTSSDMTFRFHPATRERWKDLQELFGPKGACGGCWCMFWRLRRSEFERRKGPGNRRAMKRLLDTGVCPGIIAYADGRPVAWCSVGPRDTFPVLENSRVLKRVDDEPVWSVVCFFVARSFRCRGLTVAMLKAAVRYATSHGARVVEGYPVDPKKGRIPDVFAYTGLVSAYRKAGFVEVARRSETRPIMRCFVRARARLR